MKPQTEASLPSGATMAKSVPSTMVAPPEGPRIENYGEWRAHLLARLRQQIDASADADLEALFAEISGDEAPSGLRAARVPARETLAIVTPLRLRAEGGGSRSFISTTTVFGTPVDVTLSELAIETFFPADEETAAALRARARG